MGKFLRDFARSSRLGWFLIWKTGSGDILSNLIDYVHLNPIRAGMIDSATESLMDYEGSSLRRG
jgi:hypothetical protein